MPGNPIKLLIIEDNPDDRLVYRRYLQSVRGYSYQIWEEELGKNGVASARAVQPACIIVDYHLPDLDGLEVVHQVRNHAETADIPVIVLTGSSSDNVAVTMIKQGVSDFLIKNNVTPESLHYAILQALEKASLHKIINQQNRELAEKNRSLENALAEVKNSHDELEVRIVERTRELQTVNKALQLQAQILTTMQEGLAVISEEARIILTNTAFDQMFGYQSGELIGCHLDILNAGTPAERSSLTSMYLKEVQERGAWRGRVIKCRKDGTTFPSLVRMSKVQIANQDYIVNLQEDVTEREEREAKAREQESLANVGSTAVRLTHEIGNRLNGLSTSTQLLERHLRKQMTPDVTILSETVNNLKSDIVRMTKFLQDLRTLARAYRLNVAAFDPISLIQDVLKSVEPLCQRSGITIISELQPSSSLVYADSERCREVLQHLITNAIEAMPEGGALTVRSMQGNQRVRISIHDTGLGIPHDLDIFAPFITTKPGGTGLGLTISLQLVIAQQGNLTFSSSSDQGTTFVLELPCATEVYTQEASLDGASNASSPPIPKRMNLQSDPTSLEPQRSKREDHQRQRVFR